MRRKDREVTKIEELLEIINQCTVCRVAMQDEKGLYIVPLNFGYTYENGLLILYFHSAKEGRKIDAFKQNSAVCFEMDCEHRLIEAEKACDYAYSFKSIIGNGTVSFVDDIPQKTQALTHLMRHQSGKEFTFDEKMAASITVFQITVENFIGKYHK